MAKDMSAPRSLEFVRTFVNSLDIEEPEHDPFLDTAGAGQWLGSHGLPSAHLAHTGEGDVNLTWPRLARYLAGSALTIASDTPGRISLKATAADTFGQLRGLLTA